MISKKTTPGGHWICQPDPKLHLPQSNGENVVSLRGTFNVYEYLQATAFFYGFDFAGSYHFTDNLSGYAKAQSSEQGIQTKITTSLSSPLIEWIGE